MAQGLKNAQLVSAVRAATKALVDKHGGQTAAAEATGLKQQNVSNWLRKGSPTLESLLELAAASGSTVDALLAEHAPLGSHLRKLASGNAVRRRMSALPGWAEAVERSKGERGSPPDWAWAMAGDVVLPVEPSEVTTLMAADLARFISNHMEVSVVTTREPKARGR